MLREHADAVEADLQHHYRVDLGDHWRRDGTGRRLLSLRRLRVLIRHLPPSANTSSALVGSAVPTVEAQLLAQLWELVASLGSSEGKAPKHPLLESTRSTAGAAKRMAPGRQRALMAARARAAARRHAIESGEIT